MCKAPLRRVGTLALLACLALRARPAAAAPRTSPLPELHLTYVAPAECPKRSDLLEDLGRRVEPAWRTGTDPRTFNVHIERLPDGSFSGKLEVTGPERELEERTFEAETCDAVSSALVVFIAIALDPAFARAHEPEPMPVPSIEEPVQRTAPPPPPPRQSAPAPAPAPLARRPVDAWEWTSSVGVFYLRTPLDAWGPRVDAELARTFGGSRVSPALRVSWGSAEFQTHPTAGGTATFLIRAARASACARLDLAPAPVVVAPCAGFEQGSLRASSSDLPLVGHASSSWSAMAGLARASLRVLPWLAIEGEVGLAIPFSRPAFALSEPFRIIYRPSRVLFTAGAGLAVTARLR